MSFNNFSIPLGLIVILITIDVSYGLSVKNILHKTIQPIVPSETKIHSDLPSSKKVSYERIRINSSTFKSTQVQELENYGLLDDEARRAQRLKRLENHRFDSGGTIHNSEHQETSDGVIPEGAIEDFVLGPDYLDDMKQQNSIISDSPAILLQSSAGTGKTTALAGRVAHLIQSQKIQPQNMIILSFTNRDASSLKEKALNILYEQGRGMKNLDDREILEKKLWSGTLHSFAINILQNYNTHTSPLRIISTREMKNRIRQCLGRINTMSHERMLVYKNALVDAKQSTAALVQYLLRCLELWKEAGVLPSPYINDINFTKENKHADNRKITKDDLIELAMRLGIPESSAILAYEISGDYQTLHASAGTSDPADVATIAYEFLLSNPKVLNKIRSKLEQVILDEYQDVSVSQHRFLRLVITGISDDHNRKTGVEKQSKFAVLTDDVSMKQKQIEEEVCYNVPNLCAAGDANQSIYGWRGAAPSLTVEGFRRDFPQGIVVPLNTSYRLPRHILNAANVLLGQEPSQHTATFDTSPAAILSKQSLTERHAILQLEDGVMNESKSSVIIHGLWDTREEAKFIAQEIRRRAKERIQMCKQAFQQLSNEGPNELEGSLLDSSDVAIMVRSSNEMEIYKQALQTYGIPYKVPCEDKRSVSKIHYHGRQTNSLLSMKPCKIITMHNAKGDEFDDVYLAGWSEGNFPHPASLQNNRLHEERRIAYVALTRARQRVMITYPYMVNRPYFGPNGEKKDVTEQVKPSRYLYDLMPTKNKVGVEGVSWDNSVGFKEIIAGKDLPSHYAKSYVIPDGFRSNEAIHKSIHLSSSQTSVNDISSSKVSIQSTIEEQCEDSDMKIIKDGLKSIFSKVRGSSKKYKTKFKHMLQTRGIMRGRATVLKQIQNDVDKDIQTLLNATPNQIETRPLSRCTATQLGLYLASLIKKEQNIN